MEIIRKKISIDACRSHKNGLLPFIHYDTGLKVDAPNSENTNYGHFVCDLKSKNGKIIKYLDIIRGYNNCKNILRNGVFCKCIKTSSNKLGLKNINTISSIEDECEILVEISDNIYDYKPLDKSLFKKENDVYIYNDENIENDLIFDSFYVLISDYQLIKSYEMWGDERGLIKSEGNFKFLQFVDENIINRNGVEDEFELVAPTVDIPILIENECIDNGIYYPYEYSLIDDEIISIYENIPDKNIVVENNNTDKIFPITAESKLTKLWDNSAFNIADNYYGLLKGWEDENGYDCSKLFKCTYYEEICETPLTQGKNIYQNIITKNSEGHWGWWECEATDVVCECKDGEDNIKSGDKSYRNITILSCLPYYVPAPQLGDTYYFMVRYQNGKISPSKEITSYKDIKKLTYPFEAGKKVNIETYDNSISYDKVLSIDINDDLSCTVKYVIGATEGIDDSGIFYEETLTYVSGNTLAWIDGVMEAELYYETMDFDSASEYIVNKDYGTGVNVRMAQIYKMECGKIFYNEIEVPLFTKEGLENMVNEPKFDIDMTFNRGNAAGWEKHFKLSECNTMQDLENYGNNVFNL